MYNHLSQVVGILSRENTNTLLRNLMVEKEVRSDIQDSDRTSKAAIQKRNIDRCWAHSVHRECPTQEQQRLLQVTVSKILAEADLISHAL